MTNNEEAVLPKIHFLVYPLYTIYLIQVFRSRKKSTLYAIVPLLSDGTKIV